MIVDVGNTAPNFRLPIDGGAELQLSSLKGGKVILYFYPKDSTPGCTLEAQDFRDNICLLYTSPSPRDRTRSRMPSSA